MFTAVFRLQAKVFIDASGDGRLGAEAGAEWIQGREGKSVFNESLAVDDQDSSGSTTSGPNGGPGDNYTEGSTTMYVTFRLNFHHFDHFELDLRGHTHVRGAAFSCLRLKLADIVLI